MADRYKIIDWSQSAHYCFEFTVVDTTKPRMLGRTVREGEFMGVCECFERADAEAICAALNASAKRQEDKDDADRYRHLCEPREWSEDIQAAFDCSGNKVVIDQAVDRSRGVALYSAEPNKDNQP